MGMAWDELTYVEAHLCWIEDFENVVRAVRDLVVDL